MPPISYSAIYGAPPGNGDATAQAGFDAIVTLGGTGGLAFEIREIIATYAFVGIDYANPVVAVGNGIRSFMGRLSVLRGPAIKSNISNLPGFPNPQLLLPYPREYGELIYDQIINIPGKPHKFTFPASDANWIGALRAGAGQALNVVLLAGSAYDNTGAGGDFTAQQLHVLGTPLELSNEIQIGPFHTVG